VLYLKCSCFMTRRSMQYNTLPVPELVSLTDNTSWR